MKMRLGWLKISKEKLLQGEFVIHLKPYDELSIRTGAGPSHDGKVGSLPPSRVQHDVRNACRSS